MTSFHSLRDFCLRLFGAPNLSVEHIVDIWVEDPTSVWPHGSEGMRVAFSLTYSGVNRIVRLDGAGRRHGEHPRRPGIDWL